MFFNLDEICFLKRDFLLLMNAYIFDQKVDMNSFLPLMLLNAFEEIAYTQHVTSLGTVGALSPGVCSAVVNAGRARHNQVEGTKVLQDVVQICRVFELFKTPDMAVNIMMLLADKGSYFVGFACH